MVLLGPPGAGKGTQATRLSERTGVPVLGTGELLSRHIATGTALGEQARACVERGELVPDDLVTAMVRERLSNNDCTDGFIVDGFPRTVPQAEALDLLLAERSERLDAVVELAVDEGQVLARIRGRARAGHRLDDTVDTARNRLRVFAAETAPLRDYYRQQGLLATVDGNRAPDEVTASIDAALGEHVDPKAGRDA
ncbi:MAG: adenylate kinase [Streptosporangiales bacterium]